MKILVRNDNNLVDTVADNIQATDFLRAEKAAYLAGSTKYYTGDYEIIKEGKVIGYIGHLNEGNSTVFDVAVVPEDIFTNDSEGKQIMYVYTNGVFSRFVE